MSDMSESEGKHASQSSDHYKCELLKPLLYSPADISAWLAGNAFPFSKYDHQLGYLHINRDFREGLHGSLATYRYDHLGSRQMFAHGEKPCRINTYGNSFTSWRHAT